MTAGDSRTTNQNATGDLMVATVERLDDGAARELVERIESLLARLESLPDQLTRTMALDAVEALVRLYGEGLARVMEQIVGAGDSALASCLARDELVSHLLVLHGLHPESLDERVRRALDDVRPYLQSRGGDVELLTIEGGVARVRLMKGGQGGAPSSKGLRPAVEGAVLGAAPELEGVEVEGAPEAGSLVTIEGPRRSGADGRASREPSHHGAAHPPQQPAK